MAARKTAKPKVTKCPDCDGKGETAVTVRVGARKGRATGHQQSAMCLTCWGAGEIPTDD
ncbi:hypothetical protein AB0C70_34705 [Streptomyces sp. NPDC048564]|uniref:hypothetical protein n=1 Tax=Streptomyces sp. NPDC048564 TaxID=3155760 RepID=UPI0034121477